MILFIIFSLLGVGIAGAVTFFLRKSLFATDLVHKIGAWVGVSSLWVGLIYAIVAKAISLAHG